MATIDRDRAHGDFGERGSFVEHLDLRLEASGDGTARMRLPYRPEVTNGTGAVHGGAIVSLCDQCFYVALASIYGHRQQTTTAQLACNFLAPALPPHDLIAEAKVLKSGRRIVYGEVYVRSGERLVAHATFELSQHELRTQVTTAINLRRTALYDAHLALGARMVPFGGFEMPVQYAGVLREHEAVRKRAGLFDLSHMGQIALRGSQVGAWADPLTVNSVGAMKAGQARYNLFCNERGGVHDDVIFYRLEAQEWLLVVNAGNARKMWSLLESSPRGAVDVALENRHGTHALIAIQGPASAAILTRSIGDAAERERIAAMKYYTCARATAGGIPVLLARTGYTGEDGFELFVENARAVELWEALLRDGAPEGLEACGLGARDVLRLEAGMPLYGHELDEDITPLQAGLGWAVKFEKGPFAGRETLAAQRAAGDYRRIAGFVLDGRAPARAGYPVMFGDDPAGEVRSGSPAPSVENRNIGTALVVAEASAPGARIAVEIRGNPAPATIVPMPFYRRKS